RGRESQLDPDEVRGRLPAGAATQVTVPPDLNRISTTFPPTPRYERAIVQGMSQRPLLCELHAHTTWSDGVLSIREVVDLYGRHGFDVLCITDHVVSVADPHLLERGRSLDDTTWDAYVETIFDEGERARALYDLLVIPGAELTDNQADPDESAHALALGLS